ncbi:hypothetical protein D0469_15865 [Peribacillus saganii]|uniref:YwpF-like protein n=1 Tax=Peribacillus saganii TaxID=2303992 RepID=A0A372LKC8_9BACI|nr:YwpF family protein [Peribacillus saganii]RFU67097.1 hypothetical protein D0469_15865 [Peribacillus saganii]
MKTFKLVSLQLFNDKQEAVDVELTDGLIINKEDDDNTWLVEALLQEKDYKILENAISDKQDVELRVVITKKENDPAAFQTALHSVKNVEDLYSVLFEGHLKRTKQDYAELLLQDLIHKGKSGSDLVTEFKEKIRTRPRISVQGKK